MNKLRLIKIYELRGLIHPIETNMIDLLDDIEISTYNSSSMLFLKNSMLYFTYYLNTNNIYLEPNIYQLFKCSKEETRVIMKYLLEKHLKLKIIEVL